MPAQADNRFHCISINKINNNEEIFQKSSQEIKACSTYIISRNSVPLFLYYMANNTDVTCAITIETITESYYSTSTSQRPPSK